MSDQPNAVVRQGAAALWGIARNVQFRSEVGASRHAVQVLTFRLEQRDALGTELSPVLVELRGAALEGQILDGEEVAVAGKWRHGRVVAQEVVSQTTGASMRARRPSAWLLVPFGILLLMVLAFFALVTVAITRG
jgi:hypothetical protein